MVLDTVSGVKTLGQSKYVKKKDEYVDIWIDKQTDKASFNLYIYREGSLWKRMVVLTTFE